MTARRTLLLVLIAGLIGQGAVAGAALSAEDPPGPPLTPTAEQLQAALSCPSSDTGGEPVLLVHGTTSNPEISFGPGLFRVLTDLDYLVCTVALPRDGNDDIAVAGEYVTGAIRSMATSYERPIHVVGHSQGGMVPRWSVKWWPDISALVGDVVGIAASNHGAPAAADLCQPGCPAAFWQQIPTSQFLTALNDGDKTPGEVTYSVIYSTSDTTVPAPSPVIEGDGDDSNTAVQDVCPGREVEHSELLFDAVAVSLVLDALTHDGPANGERLPADVCTQDVHEGIDPNEAELQLRLGTAYFAQSYARSPLLQAEPPLAAYARPAEPAAPDGTDGGQTPSETPAPAAAAGTAQPASTTSGGRALPATGGTPGALVALALLVAGLTGAALSRAESR